MVRTIGRAPLSCRTRSNLHATILALHCPSAWLLRSPCPLEAESFWRKSDPKLLRHALIPEGSVLPCFDSAPTRQKESSPPGLQEQRRSGPAFRTKLRTEIAQPR